MGLTILVYVKHQGKKYDVELDPTSTGETFKFQIYSLTGVEPERQKIIVKGGQLTLILNGVTQVQTTMWDDAWRKMIAGSKFKEWPDFGTFKSGKIDLQDHTDEVWYRNIKIKQL